MSRIQPKPYKQTDADKAFVSRLNRMSYQEIFNLVLKRLRKQGKASFDVKQNSCMYLSKDNLRCAVGQLVPLGYRLKEKQDVKDLVQDQLKGLSEGKSLFLRRLQILHDNELLFGGMDRWLREMKKYAEERNLKFED